MTGGNERVSEESGELTYSGGRDWLYLITVQKMTGIEAARTWTRLACGTWEHCAPMIIENTQMGDTMRWK